MASIRRIDEVLDEPIDLSDENASQKDRKVEKGRVEFKDVSFSYREGGEPVLSHISLTAEPGETIGILGATGSGKTSLVQLIPRLYGWYRCAGVFPEKSPGRRWHGFTEKRPVFRHDRGKPALG